MRSPTGKNTNPRFDLDRNPPYQINYRAKRCGKTITASKRRITFQFGFSSASAIASGKTAVDCRGEEHEVVLIWSHMSGKRELFMDGRQVHTSKGAMGNSEFMYSWALGNHILKITASGVGEANSRQFDLELDGMSYFTFKQIYQLGDASGVRRLALPPSTTTATWPKQTKSMMYKYVGTAVDDDDDEDEYIDETPPTSEIRAPVIDLFEHDLFDSQPPTQISFPTTPFTAMHYQVAPPPQVFDSTSPIRRTVSNNNSMNAMSSYDEFAPVPVAAVTPRFDTSQILGAYENTISNTYTAMVPVSEESNSSMDIMTKSLVNLDDIMSPMNSSLTTTPGNTMMIKNQYQRFGGTGMAPTLSEMNSAFGGSIGSINTPIMNSPPAPTMMYQQQQQGFYQQQGGQQPQQQGSSHHMGQPQAMMSPNNGYNYSQLQPQQYGYAPAY